MGKLLAYKLSSVCYSLWTGWVQQGKANRYFLNTGKFQYTTQLGQEMCCWLESLKNQHTMQLVCWHGTPRTNIQTCKTSLNCLWFSGRKVTTATLPFGDSADCQQRNKVLTQNSALISRTTIPVLKTGSVSKIKKWTLKLYYLSVSCLCVSVCMCKTYICMFVK